jgi:hypothetical protein
MRTTGRRRSRERPGAAPPDPAAASQMTSALPRATVERHPPGTVHLRGDDPSAPNVRPGTASVQRFRLREPVLRVAGPGSY